jgi:hypothetical protein
LYSQTIGYGEADKNIAGEERQIETNCAVFPLSDGFIMRQKTFYTSLRQLICDGPFMVRTSVGGVPVLLKVRFAMFGWEFETQRWRFPILIDYVMAHDFHSFALSLTGNL